MSRIVETTSDHIYCAGEKSVTVRNYYHDYVDNLGNVYHRRFLRREVLDTKSGQPLTPAEAFMNGFALGASSKGQSK